MTFSGEFMERAISSYFLEAVIHIFFILLQIIRFHLYFHMEFSAKNLTSLDCSKARQSLLLNKAYPLFTLWPCTTDLVLPITMQAHKSHISYSVLA